MPYFSREFISEVTKKNDIVDIVSSHTKLKKAGSTLKGLCPFHNEKTPSFSVSPDKQLFYCFGCGVGGTVVDFVMRKDNLDFVETIKYLADRARIDIVYESDRYHEDKNARDLAYEKKQTLYRINSEAGMYYYNCLMSENGREAQGYLINRTLSRETVTSFGIGYAPNVRAGLYKHLIQKGFKEEDIEAAGLVNIKSIEEGYYDRFRNRVMFPIIDLRGNVIGFGGRVMSDDDKPKYLNSPETVIFSKSHNLFGLNFAKNDKTGQLLLVEGYMDVISLHQSGITNTVATLGTAVTLDQAKLMSRYAKEVVICYDSDGAGIAATERAIEVLRESNVKAKILQIDGAKDPDEYITKKGVEMFNLLVQNAKSVVEYKIGHLKAQYNLDNVDDKINFIQSMAEVFAKMDNAVEREAYITKIAKESEISPEAILTEVKNIAYREERLRENRANSDRERVQERNAGERITRKNKNIINAEKLLLNLMCGKSVFSSVKTDINPDDFSVPIHKRLAEIIFNTYESGENLDPMQVLSRFEGEEGAVSEILLDDKNVEDGKKAARSAVAIIKLSILEETKQKLIAEGDTIKLQQIIEEMRKYK